MNCKGYDAFLSFFFFPLLNGLHAVYGMTQILFFLNAFFDHDDGHLSRFSFFLSETVPCYAASSPPNDDRHAHSFFVGDPFFLVEVLVLLSFLVRNTFPRGSIPLYHKGATPADYSPLPLHLFISPAEALPFPFFLFRPQPTPSQ